MIRIAPLLILITWVLSPFLAFSLGNKIFVVTISIFLLYFIYKITIFSLGSVVGFMRYRDEISKNWSIFNDSTLPKHLIAIPLYKEDFSIVLRQIDSIIKQTYPTELFRIVVSIEESHYEEGYQQIIKSTYGEDFASQISIISHQLEEGAVAGAASNRKNAAKYFVDNCIEQNEVSEYLITSPDCDAVFHPKFFARVTTEYLQRGKPKYEFYQTGMYTFANNIEDVNALIQVTSYGLTLALLSLAATHPKERYTFSCFTLPLETLIEVEYWDNTIPIDDSPLYWRAAIKLGTPLVSRAFFIPVSVDATKGHSFWDTVSRQLKQFYRWAWGIVTFPQAISYIRHSSLSLYTKGKLFFFLMESIALQGTWVFVLSSFFLIFNQFIDSGNIVLHSAVNIIGITGLVSLIPVFFIKLYISKEISYKHMMRILFVSIIELPLTVILVLWFGIYPLLRAYFDYAVSKKKVASVQWADKLTKIS